MADSWIHMGAACAAHGIKGEICIDWHADSPCFDNPLCFRRAMANHVACVRWLCITARASRLRLNIG